jgi:hypothetical protein
MSELPRFGFDHLDRLSDDRGLFEHADGIERRVEHGYCTDDNARLLVVTTRGADSGTAHRLNRVALKFVLDAQGSDGRFRNRMDRSGRWTDRPATDDCWGRSLWALGTTAAHHSDATTRQRARRAFDDGVRHRSRWPRAMAFAALGAADMVAYDPDHGSARALLFDALTTIGPIPAGDWMWPEPRLSYANAALAEAVIAAGAALEHPLAIDRGLTMLGWLLDLATPRTHLSVTGAGGRGPNEHGPQFDQQPIEAGAIADACWRAYTLTGDARWSQGVTAAAGWFAGENDSGLVMVDDTSGGSFDGLRPDSVNLNEGAESTLAFVSTMQRARSFAPAL